MVLWIIFTACQQQTSDQLAAGFADPPSSYRPWVYWYWIDENISMEGITADLEAMARVGIGRALIGHVSPGKKRGPVRILSENWWKMLEHAIREGNRTGVDIGFFNGPGWSQSGGPWIGPDQAMRYVVSNDTLISGPGIFRKRYPVNDPIFKRVALQAFPVRFESDRLLSDRGHPLKSEIEEISTDAAFRDIRRLIDGNKNTHILFPETISSDDSFSIDIRFRKPTTLRSLTFDFLPVSFQANITLYSTDTSGIFRSIRQIMLDRRNINFEIGPKRFEPVQFALPGITTRRVKLVFKDVIKNHGAGLNEMIFGTGTVVDQAIEKQLGKMYSDPLPPWDAYLWAEVPEPDGDDVIDRDSIINLSEKIDSTGNLIWEVPDGHWVVLESGTIPTGATNVPVPPEATGYECDKFTEEAIETHFNAFIGKFLERVPAEDRKSLRTVVIDSYEVGPQNWTGNFRDVFNERYGYDPMPWLPVFNGRVVESAGLSDRFLWDVRRLTADLIANVYVRRLRELSNSQNLELWMENYGHWGFPAEFLQYGGQGDQVSGEFWFQNHLWDLGPQECRAASSTAHTYGKTEVFAEAFTAGFNFRQYPAIMKSRGDRMFCEGINHFVQHVYIHQPWDDRMPGVTTWFGMAYQRHNTWFEQSIAWNEYLQRCHYMLQQGLPVSDVCYFTGEDAPKMTGILSPTLPKGYDFDFINAEVILNRLSVRDGMLVLPDGKTYRLLVLPPQETMRPELLKKIRDLLNAGAVILGPAPVRSPSLENYPDADNEVRKISLEIWGQVDHEPTIATTVGTGRLFSGTTLENVFENILLFPDFICNDTTISWTHRKTRETDIYFLSNSEPVFKTAKVSFRVSGKIPEIWDPATGKTERSALFSPSGFRTEMPVNLDPYGSVFIVFREPLNHGHVMTMDFNGANEIRENPGPRLIHDVNGHAKLITADSGNFLFERNDGELNIVEVRDIPVPLVVSGPWEMIFPSNRDVPERTVFQSLISWPEHPDPGIRHFSGTAAYFNTFELPDMMTGNDMRLILDLGSVHSIAEVIVNGRDLGILWKEPFQVNITGAVKSGRNEILVRVTNTWWNRLVGDEKFPDGFQSGQPNGPRTFTTHKAWDSESELLPSGLLGPVRILAEKEVLVW